MDEKQQLRQHIRRLKQQCGTGDGADVLNLLCCHPRIRQARTLLIFHALPDEVPVQRLADQWLSEGKCILLPRVVDDTTMEICRYTGIGSLRQGAFGIMEPTGEVVTDYTHIDVALVPGMAFDAVGHRLGRGRGYYDRFLSPLRHIYKIGVCFPFQLVEHVPSAPHDVVMDEVIGSGR